MSVLFLLIGVSLTVALVFLLAFLWASSSGQYDDDYTPSVRMLFDDSAPRDDSGPRSAGPSEPSPTASAPHHQRASRLPSSPSSTN